MGAWGWFLTGLGSGILLVALWWWRSPPGDYFEGLGAGEHSIPDGDIWG